MILVSTDIHLKRNTGNVPQNNAVKLIPNLYIQLIWYCQLLQIEVLQGPEIQKLP